MINAHSDTHTHAHKSEGLPTANWKGESKRKQLSEIQLVYLFPPNKKWLKPGQKRKQLPSSIA